MKKSALVLFFLLPAITGSAQLICDSLATVSIKNIGVCVDRQQQIYAYTETGFSRFSKEGKLLQTHQFAETGELTDIDINPAGNIILLYKNAPILVILDKNFIEIGRIRLDNIGLNEAGLCTFTSDGNVLLYTDESRSVIKIDFNGNIKQPKTTLMLPEEVEFFPSDMREEKNVIFMADPNKGLYRFNVYGKNMAKKPGIGTGFLQLVGDKILFVQNDKILFNQLKTMSSVEIKLPQTVSGLRQVALAGTTLVATDGHTIYFYKIRP